MNKNKICHVVYSHTSYADVWPAYFSQTKKYFNELSDKAIFLNEKSDQVPSDYQQIFYRDKDSYVNRLISCLKQLKKQGFDLVFFEHEDMFLYDYPRVETLEKYIKAIGKGYFDIIRLIKGGNFVSEESIIDPTLFELKLESDWIFSIQPSIWNIDAILRILNYHKGQNIWVFEAKSQKTCRNLKVKAAFSHGEGKQKGSLHFANDVYPYIATAVVKGKWNLKEYPILEDILRKNKIDKNIRGEI